MYHFLSIIFQNVVMRLHYIHYVPVSFQMTQRIIARHEKTLYSLTNRFLCPRQFSLYSYFGVIYKEGHRKVELSAGNRHMFKPLEFCSGQRSTVLLYFIHIFTKDQTFIFYLLLLQLVLCRVAALKSLPVHHP